MKFAIASICLTFSALTADGASISIKNPSFEDQGDTLNGNGNGTPIASDPGDFTAGVVPEWDDNFTLTNNAGLFNPTGSTSGAAHSGSLVTFLQTNVNGGSYLVQNLELDGGGNVTAEPLSNITITGWISNRFSSAADPLLRVSLRVAPNTNIMAPMEFDAPNDPTWTEFTASFDLPDSATLGVAAGQPVFLVFDSIGPQILLDDISGTTSIPEPSSALICGCAGLLLLRRRRS